MHPIAFNLGPLSVHWYGVLVASGFLAGLWTASRRAVRYGISPQEIGDSGPWILIGAILGARILYVLTYWNESFAGKPLTEIFMIQHGGLVYYGGLIGAIVAVLIYCRWKKIPVWRFGDVMAPSIALGYVFGRLGCLMNGCCYGRACSLPWAITFPPGSEIHGPVHPTQIYDSLLNLALYGFLAWLYRRRKFDGQVFAIYLVCYAFTRSLVEYFRGDYNTDHIHGFFTPAQFVSVLTLAAGLILFGVLRRHRPVRVAR